MPHDSLRSFLRWIFTDESTRANLRGWLRALLIFTVLLVLWSVADGPP